jgi:hypothetical protein
MAGREELSSAVGAPKSAAKISLVRLADFCTSSDGVGSIAVVMVGCVWEMTCRELKCNFLVESNFGASSPHFITEPFSESLFGMNIKSLRHHFLTVTSIFIGHRVAIRCFSSRW